MVIGYGHVIALSFFLTQKLKSGSRTWVVATGYRVPKMGNAARH